MTVSRDDVTRTPPAVIRTAGWEPLLDIRLDDDLSWSVSIRAMPGHVGAGKTLWEAILNAADAAEAWVEALRGSEELSA